MMSFEGGCVSSDDAFTSCGCFCRPVGLYLLKTPCRQSVSRDAKESAMDFQITRMRYSLIYVRVGTLKNRDTAAMWRLECGGGAARAEPHHSDVTLSSGQSSSERRFVG